MRYTYTTYDQTHRRVDICTRYEEAEKIANEINGYITVHDNSNAALVATLSSVDEMHEWSDKLARDSTWCNKEDRNRVLGKDLPHKKWDPLDEQETGIHKKERPDEFDQVQFARYPSDKGLTTFPDNNAKTRAAAGKPTFSPIPPIALMGLGAAMQDGVNKYGIFNWRDAAVTSTVFYDAVIRHLLAWYSGERNAPDSGIHHLAHAMAGLAIIMDAEYNDCLNDDRKKGKKVTLDEFRFVKG